MTIDQIHAVQAQTNVKYDLAKKIREILDAGAEHYGAEQWEEDSVESEVLELVTGEQ